MPDATPHAVDAPRPLAEVDAELTAPGGPFEIDVLDIRGVPTRVWRHAPATLTDILRRSGGNGGREMIVYEGERLTYGGHLSAAATVAAALRDGLGIRPGDRVAIAMRNLPEWSVAFWGAAAAGAVVVSLNAWWTGDELAYGLADSGTRVVFADSERAARIAPHLGSLPGVEALVVARPGADLPGLARRWDDAIGPVRGGMELPDVGASPDDDATIFYTSGTTGEPKGVVGTHRNICSSPVNAAYVAARAAARWGAPPAAPGRPARYLLSVPLFHATGCHSLLVGHTYNGGTIVMMHRWDPARALELIEQERITSFGGVPTMALQVLDHPDLGRRDTSSLTAVRYGGAPAPPELAGRIGAAFGTPAMNGWGMTETSALATMHVGRDHEARPDSVGPPVPVVELRITDPDGASLPAGQVGELRVRGPNVVRGYWGKPEETAAAFEGGWLRTGDLARVDEEGFLFVVDRAKDMLIRGGENVYCMEVEGALHEHPGVAEAAVIGIPHPTLGEEVGAVVALLPGHDVGEGELRAFAAARLAPFKVPSRIWVRRGELPRNPAGKLLKRQLRAEVGAG